MLASSSAPAVLQQVLPVLLFFVLPTSRSASLHSNFARPRAGSAGMALGALLPLNWGTGAPPTRDTKKNLAAETETGRGRGRNSKTDGPHVCDARASLRCWPMPASSAPAVLQQVLLVLLFFILPYLSLRFFAFARASAGSAGMALGTLLPGIHCACLKVHSGG
ncbi:hypothetical protein K438DRAFT_1758700 [Mycena galopus ATCC 62051]|nr:hypothetical protein K438DRAFT_1758700 [Mycena galopus ATCC 62051]